MAQPEPEDPAAAHRPSAAEGLRHRLRVRPALGPVLPAPTVSVVIPHHNYGRYLPAAVASALRQPEVDIDVIVVDDASAPESLVVARHLAETDARIRLVEHRVNRGPVVTFNDGLPLARGRYLVRLDADDLLTPGSLARSVRLLESYPSVGFAYGHPLHFSSSTPRPRSQVRSWTLWPGREWLERRCRVDYNCITSPEVVMRTSVVDAVGGQRALKHAHDMEMWLRLSAVSDVGHVDGPDQAFHREHSESLSARHVDALTDLRERALAFDTLFSGLGHRIDPAGHLWADTRHRLATEAVGRACHEYDRGRGGTLLTEQFAELGLALSPGVRRERVWTRLEAHRRRESAGSPFAPPRVARALRRRVRVEWARLRWHRTGV